MEYQIIVHLLGNTPNEPCKFMTKNWAEINDDARERYKQIVKLNVRLQW